MIKIFKANEPYPGCDFDSNCSWRTMSDDKSWLERSKSRVLAPVTGDSWLNTIAVPSEWHWRCNKSDERNERIQWLRLSVGHIRWSGWQTVCTMSDYYYGSPYLQYKITLTHSSTSILVNYTSICSSCVIVSWPHWKEGRKTYCEVIMSSNEEPILFIILVISVGS